MPDQRSCHQANGSTGPWNFRSTHDPPLLLLHGDQDPQMPVNQAIELQGAYKDAPCKVRLEVLHGAAHGGKAFYDAKRTSLLLLTD